MATADGNDGDDGSEFMYNDDVVLLLQGKATQTV